MFPSQNEHQPAAHEQAASDGIADDAVLLMGANEGKAGVAGLNRRATCLCQTGASLPTVTAPRVVATRDIRRYGRTQRFCAGLIGRTDPGRSVRS